MRNLQRWTLKRLRPNACKMLKRLFGRSWQASQNINIPPSSRKGASRGEGQRGAVPGGSGGVPGGVEVGRRNPDPPPGLNHAKISFDGARRQRCSLEIG